MYMVIESGSNSPVKISTMRFYDDLTDFFRVRHIEYINLCSKSEYYRNDTTFQTWLCGRYGRWRIYECSPTKNNGKPKDLAKNEGNMLRLLTEAGVGVDTKSTINP